jgi:hypothetical protein
MSGITLPNMSLIMPALGGDAGTWDDELQTAFTQIDSHNHSAGQGVQVPSAGININANLSFGGFGITNLASLTFAEIPALAAGADVIYVDSTTHELMWRSHSGVNVQLTSGGALNVAAFAGGIGGDYTTVAAQLNYDSANTQYTFKGASPSFDWAGLASGDLHLYQEGTTESVFVGLKAPDALAASYAMTLPAGLPGKQSALTFDSSGALAAKGGSLYLGTQVFTTGGTYTPTTGTTRVIVEAVGGGGGGGGVSTGATQCGAGGGGSGSYARWAFGDGTSLITGGVVIIGAGGTAGDATGGNGGAGGDTTIGVNGTEFTASGGSGGTGVSTSTGIGAGGAPGSGSDLAFLINADDGQPGSYGQGLFNTTHFYSIGGAGGSSPLGHGGPTRFTFGSAPPYSLPGVNGSGYGAGGSGACITTGHTGTAEAGGTGSGGIVIVHEFM